MAEPLDTVRRVLGGARLEVGQLQQALAVLDAHRFEGRADIDRARHQVLDDLDRLGVAPAPPGAYAAVRRLGSGVPVPPAELPAMERLLADHLTDDRAERGHDQAVTTALAEVRGLMATTRGAPALAAPAARGRAVPGTSGGSVTAVPPRRWSPGAIGGIALAGAVLVLLVAGALGHGSGARGPDPGAARADPRTEPSVPAWDACIQAVAGRLQAQSGASFESILDGDFQTAGTTVRVSGSVDTQDAFGDPLRAAWVCTAEVDAAGGTSNVQVLSIG